MVVLPINAINRVEECPTSVGSHMGEVGVNSLFVLVRNEVQVLAHPSKFSWCSWFIVSSRLSGVVVFVVASSEWEC
jgi:hypothetical protein